MSNQTISKKQIINSYQMTKTSKEYNENTTNPKNEIKEPITQKHFTKETGKNFTGQPDSNTPQFQISNNLVENTSNKIGSYQNQTNNLDSSLQQRSTISQSRCICGKWKTDTNSTYGTIRSLIGCGYCTCDDAKESPIGCTCYKKNTNKTLNKTFSSNDQNIFIQEGNTSEYCNCDERDERKIFSNATSEYNMNVQNVLTDEDMNICTCGQKSTIYSNDTRDYNNLSNVQNTSNMVNQNNMSNFKYTSNMTKKSQTNKEEYNNQNNMNNLQYSANMVTRYQTIDQNNYNNQNNMNKMQYSSNMITTSYNELPIQTTDNENREINVANTNVTKIESKEIINIRKEIREQIKRELNEEQENEQVSWNGENYIQVIERLQFLTDEPPELRVQFMNDMMINRTINRDPIQVLIPIPENYIQKQGVLEVLSEQKEKKEEEERDLNENLCPENVDLLNISNAYSIPVPSFNNLEIEKEEMYIIGIPKKEESIIEVEPEPEEKQINYSIENYSLFCKGNEMEPYVIENYAWDINPSERMWTGDMRAIRINKLNIEVPNKPDWNSLIEEELVSKLDVKAIGKDKEKERQERERKENERKERLERRKRERERKEKERKEKKKKKKKKVKSKKYEDELPEEQQKREEVPSEHEKEDEYPEKDQQEEDEEENEENVEEIEEIEEIEEVEEKSEIDIEKEKQREKRKKEKELRKQRKDQKNFKTKNFSLTYKENKKQFKKIDIGDNEIITLKPEKRVLQPVEKPKKELKPSDETNIVLGGNGFDINKYKWSPVPFNAQSMTIEKTKIETPLENVSTDKLEMPATTKRRQNWNLVNNLSSESTVNILTNEKKLSEQKIRPLTVLGDTTKKNKWDNKIRKQKGIKLGFPSTKKWYLKICKENDILYEQEADDVIINDDYNNVKGPEMRPITATIIKVNEEEETSSVSSYDVFENLIIKKANYEFDYGSKASLLKSKNGIPYTFSNGSLGPGLGGPKKLENNNGNGAKFSDEKKNINKPKGMRDTRNLIGEKRKKIEFIREEPEQKNYLRI